MIHPLANRSSAPTCSSTPSMPLVSIVARPARAADSVRAVTAARMQDTTMGTASRRNPTRRRQAASSTSTASRSVPVVPLASLTQPPDGPVAVDPSSAQGRPIASRATSRRHRPDARVAPTCADGPNP